MVICHKTYRQTGISKASQSRLHADGRDMLDPSPRCCDTMARHVSHAEELSMNAHPLILNSLPLKIFVGLLLLLGGFLADEHIPL